MTPTVFLPIKMHSGRTVAATPSEISYLLSVGLVEIVANGTDKTLITAILEAVNDR